MGFYLIMSCGGVVELKKKKKAFPVDRARINKPIITTGERDVGALVLIRVHEKERNQSLIQKYELYLNINPES